MKRRIAIKGGVILVCAAVALLCASPLSARAKSPKLDLNTASEKDLEDLPGVGPVTARKIIDGRPYSSLSDLSRAGVTPSTIEKIRPLVTVKMVRSERKETAGRDERGNAGVASGGTASSPPSGRRSEETSKGSQSRQPNVGSSSNAEQPAAKGMVWVNLKTKVYHREGDPFYGKTKRGKYMNEADAVRAGYRLSREKDEPKS